MLRRRNKLKKVKMKRTKKATATATATETAYNFEALKVTERTLYQLPKFKKFVNVEAFAKLNQQGEKLLAKKFELSLMQSEIVRVACDWFSTDECKAMYQQAKVDYPKKADFVKLSFDISTSTQSRMIEADKNKAKKGEFIEYCTKNKDVRCSLENFVKYCKPQSETQKADTKENQEPKLRKKATADTMPTLTNVDFKAKLKGEIIESKNSIAEIEAQLKLWQLAVEKLKNKIEK